ncbi:MAG: peptidoglycan-binding protein [Alphaproteobacteria bacterium]|nr:peptidoglycan-binding protein [Alphaproteobacteria bacterium]
MSQRVFNGGLAVFASLTIALAVNLMGLQEGSRELAPAPVMAISAATKAPPKANGADEPMLLNDAKMKETAIKVQRELQALGYLPGTTDGTESLMSRAAIMAYEYDNGLPLTAAADASLLQRLLGLRPPPSSHDKNAGLPTSPQAKRVMQTVQQSLKQLRYEPGPVDGTYSVETERAIRDFESDNNLAETGRVSGRLIAGLANLADHGKLKVSRR